MHSVYNTLLYLCYDHSLFVIFERFSSCEISGFRREVEENCALLPRYAASSGNSLTTFRDNLLVPSSSLLKTRQICCPETSVRNSHSLAQLPERTQFLVFLLP